MSHNVERLKQLLFDSEAHALRDLALRIDSLTETEARTRENLSQLVERLTATNAAAREELSRRIDTITDIDGRARQALVQRVDALAVEDASARAALRQKIDEIYARVGSAEAMTESVADIIDTALRRAEIAKHSELAQSIAPLVVSTIKTELRNSQDEMVEALYPITGRLVKSYVASAIKDLSDQMNRRLEQNAVMLRLQSLTTGRSVAELALAGTRTFDIKALYLIRRGTGELVAHWPESSVSGREHAMSGVLAAVTEFANEAFSADQSALRQIDLGDEEVYLRGSPIYLLAARCSGAAPQGVEQVLDDAFLSAVERQHQIDGDARASDKQRQQSGALAKLGEDLQRSIASQIEDIQRPSGFGALKLLAAMVVLPLLGLVAWNWYVDHRIESTRAMAEQIIAADPAMLGYPAHIDVTARGRSVTISGLTPSQPAKQRIVEDLQRSLPGVALRDQLTVVAGSGIVVPDLTPELDRVRNDVSSSLTGLSRAALLRADTRADRRLDQAASDLAHAVSIANAWPDQDKAKLVATEIAAVDASHDALARTLTSSAGNSAPQAASYQALTARLHGAADTLLTLTGANTPPAARTAPARSTDAVSIDVAVEQFATAAERVAMLSSSLAVAAALRPAPPPASPAPPQPSARDQLEAFARAHAVFFTTNTDYRDAAKAAETLTALAGYIKAAATLVRVVGYTDEVGPLQRNSQLAVDRAAKVRTDLLALGVPEKHLVAVGRANALDLSDMRGAQSPNRRVEFELGFEGEVGP